LRLPPVAAVVGCQRSFQYTPAVMSAISTMPAISAELCVRLNLGEAPELFGGSPVSAANSRVASRVRRSAGGPEDTRLPNAATIFVLGTEASTSKSVSVGRAKKV